MKLLLLIGVLTFVGIDMCKSQGAQRPVCQNENCTVNCEPGTHLYSTGCSYLTPEATCDEPNPQTDKSGMICDYMKCYCDAPTVRNTVTNECVPLEKCPKPDTCKHHKKQ